MLKEKSVFPSTQPYHCWAYTPKEVINKTTCTKIFIVALFVVAKNWKIKECPSIGGWLNKLWYMLVMEYYYAKRNNELEKFHVNWNDLQELMQSEKSRTGEHCIQRLIHCGTIEHNGLL